jgi:hypothetical protein
MHLIAQVGTANGIYPPPNPQKKDPDKSSCFCSRHRPLPWAIEHLAGFPEAVAEQVQGSLASGQMQMLQFLSYCKQ